MTSSPTLQRPAATALPVTVDRVSRRFRSAPASAPGSATRAEADRVVLREVSLTIRAGEIVALIGSSGSGKSTLLRQIGGLDLPDSGQVRIGGTRVTGIDQRCAVAFQEPRLLPWRTLAHNVELGLGRDVPRPDRGPRVAGLLDLVHLADSAHLRPRQVSGGMAQRVSLARALARNPGVLLLDEPFGALDALTRLQMQDLLLEVHAAAPATIVLVTHDVDEALQLADRIVLIGEEPHRPGEGSVILSVTAVPGRRPRDRGDASLAALRAHLLDGLGVPSHHRSAANDAAAAPVTDPAHSPTR